MAVADLGTLLTAIFAAVAALAAWATVATSWVHQRAAQQPNISAGFLAEATGGGAIEFVSMGPGLAIQVSYLLISGSNHEGGLIGRGHMQAGERKLVPVRIDTPGNTVDFIWACRDIDQRLHVWSYAGEHKRFRKGEYPSLGACFDLMYSGARETAGAGAERVAGGALPPHGEQ